VNGGPDEPDREEDLAVPGGALHVERFLPRGPCGGVIVFVHGFDAHIGPYRPLGRALAESGFATILYDGRGHGRSSGRRGHIARFEQYVEDLEAVAASARLLAPGQPLTLLGHSQGGLVVLDGLVRGMVTPERAVLAAPWLGLAMPIPWWKRAASPLFARLWPTLSMDNGLRAVDISRNPAVAERREQDPLFHHIASARWFEEVLRTQARLRLAPPVLPVPTLVLVAGHDRIVSSEATLAFASTAGPAVAVRRYDALYHDLFLEPERDQVVADVVSWLRTPAASGPELGRASRAVPGTL
jgi:lysophospholipase